jgi:hypothetical protein
MSMQINDSTFTNIFSGLEFLLSHLSKPDFPRTIATKLTEGKQVPAYDNIEALAYYKQADYMDCRLAAYPYTAEKCPHIIDFIMLDLDLNNFHYSRQKLDKALKKILLSLKKLGIVPTVIWSGNGYHVLVTLEPLPATLEDMTEFNKFAEPSKKILDGLSGAYLTGPLTMCTTILCHLAIVCCVCPALLIRNTILRRLI